MPYVPIVDISADPGVVGAELDEICRTVGFFQITGHGIADDVAEPAWRLATAFFDLPLDDKLSVARPAADYPYGYIPMAGESLSQSMTGADHLTPPDLKEVFNAGPPSPPGHEFADPGEAWAYSPSLWPRALPELQAAWTAYYDAMRDLGDRLMSLFARGLGLPPGFFAGHTGRCANALRAINYPERDAAALPGQLRAGAHTDYGTLTILRQDAVGGLEVLDRHGTWAVVEPVSGAFVINIGDLMARWTNDRWRSTLHRVVDPPGHPVNARRQSMPYFQNANWSALVSCLPTCLGPGETPRYEPVLAGPHLMSKFRRSVTFRESA
ncbi:MAG TPA: 2-oxoglutarate and iron-dependent oxygenase domain-containing protein [Streptosporangiaceae bacterium]|jgi:isopenicillin N synthase-like dioxygenase|nr:2-oxoglutarate and iron-dependent oxygenase domain-containing protein [Streptosporangiaceae bacterium]